MGSGRELGGVEGGKWGITITIEIEVHKISKVR
jgi:hypothetical protein